MNPKQMLVLLLVGGMLLVPGCTFPVPKMVCPAADLVAPTLSSPPNHVNMGPVPTVMLSWVYKGVAYPYPAPAPTPSKEYPCHPTKYRISLSTAPLFTDELGAEEPGGIISGGFWTTPVLQSGKTYRWSVRAVSKGVDGPPSQTRYFTIGALCEVSGLTAPILLAPANGSTVATLTPQVVFDSAMTCVPNGYLIRYSQDPTLTPGATIGGGGYYGYGYPLPELENCATYYWRVVAWRGTDSTVGPYSDTWSFKVKLPGPLCLEIVPISPILTLPPPELPVLPPGPIDEPWKVILNANCRAGPGTAYNETGFAPMGYMAMIEGRNEDGSWFRLKDPKGISCWVSRVALAVPGNWEARKVLAYPLLLLPTEKPPTEEVPVPEVSCSQYPDPKSCQLQPGCGWDRPTQSCRNQ